MTEQSMFFREETTWLRDTIHVLRVAVVFAGLIAMAGAAMHASFAATYRLHSVTIPDHAANVDPTIVARRTIRRDFLGQFSTVIRRDDQTIVCIVPWSPTLQYRREAATSPDLVRPLSHWIGGKDTLAACEAEGFGVGRFTVTTCHRMMFRMLPVASRCVESNSFTRGDAI